MGRHIDKQTHGHTGRGETNDTYSDNELHSHWEKTLNCENDMDEITTSKYMHDEIIFFCAVTFFFYFPTIIFLYITYRLSLQEFWDWHYTAMIWL